MNMKPRAQPNKSRVFLYCIFLQFPLCHGQGRVLALIFGGRTGGALERWIAIEGRPESWSLQKLTTENLFYFILDI